MIQSGTKWYERKARLGASVRSNGIFEKGIFIGADEYRGRMTDKIWRGDG